MVADKAGVSRGTVDRVLNNRSHVSPDVYDRVMAAIQETGYLTPRSTYQKTLFGQGFPPIKSFPLGNHARHRSCPGRAYRLPCKNSS